MELIKLTEIPDLQSDYEPDSVDLSTEYWTPEEEGEQRRMIFWGIGPRSVADHNDSESEVMLECALFVSPATDGGHCTVANGSKRLVAIFKSCEIARGTPVQVTYAGKKKNRTNSNMSDQWSVQTLARKKK